MNHTMLIVDGYNVIHALFPQVAKDELFARRQWLVDRLAEVGAVSGASVVLVFDGHGSENECSHPLPGAQLEVCYAGGRFIADTLIARRIAEQPADVNVTVVSADQEVQRTAARAGVSRMTPRELAAEFPNAQGVAPSAREVRMPSRLEDQVDAETLRKLEDLRRGG